MTRMCRPNIYNIKGVAILHPGSITKRIIFKLSIFTEDCASLIIVKMSSLRAFV